MSVLAGWALLAAAPLPPLLLALAWPFAALRRRALHFAPWAAAPAVALAAAALLWPELARARLELPGLLAGVSLALDRTGWAFLALTGVLWLAAGAFARSYHADDPRREAFFGFFVLTLAGNLGLVVAADALSFYLFFALMTFSAYGLVVHRRDEEALRAGRIYIVLAVAGELALLSGLFSLGVAADGVPDFGAELEASWAWLAGATEPGGRGAGLTATLLVAGFGVKAGLAPLHLWLPLAHPVAPTAASALLSGIMIKAGLLGWIRFLPEGLELPWLGTALMGVGAATAFYGVVVGLAQDESKTVLAYSSVSQMGYMALGTGLILCAPPLGPLALAGVVLYAVHHGVAKAALFLSVGVADRSGGGDPRWRRWVLLGALLPALALAGAPLTTGARAKAVLEAGLEELGGAWHTTMDALLPVAAFGTALLMARFLLTLDRRLDAASRRSAPEGSAPAASGASTPAVAGDSSRHRDSGIRGLVLPWAVLVGAGVAGILWLPWLLPDPDAVEVPSILYGVVGALVPVAAGAAVAWAIRNRPGRLGPLATLRIPPGDLLIPLEAAVRRVPLVAQARLVERARAAAAPVRLLQDRIVELAGWAAERDMLLARGSLFGAALLALVAAIVYALLA